MIATSSQPGMFPVASSHNPLTLVHTLPPPGSTTVSSQSMHTMPSTIGIEVIPMLPEGTIPTILETNNGKKLLYSCNYCNKPFGSRYNTARHEKGCKLAPPGSGGNQPNAVPILCPNCGKHFQTHDGMTRHLKKKCKLGVSTNDASSYRWTGKKVHTCKYCGKQFSTKWNAIRHENLFHTSDEPPLSSLMVVPYEPPLPEQQFVPRKPERYCRFCGNYFSTKYNAIRHERICTRISSSTGGQIQNNATTTETKSISDTPMNQTQLTTVEIQSPAKQTVQPAPQTPLQQQILLQQRQQQQNQPTQLQPQQQTISQQQLSQQIQQLQQQQQEIQRQQQQLEVPQNHQQQIIVQGQNQMQQIQQHQQAIQQHQQTQPQQVQITSQQVVFVQPFHVCKFCNKQLHTRCDPTPVLREDIHNGTINASTLQAASLQIQQPITPTVLTGVSLPMLATIPAHNITIPIQPQTQQQQRAPDTQQHPQHVQHQQVQLQIQPQPVTPQQITQQPLQQTQQVQQQQRPQMQPPAPQQQQTPQQAQAAPRAPPVPSSIQQKPHGCNYCSKHFATKWYLDQHVKIHTGQAVTCNVCSKSFVTRWHLDKHARVHLPGAKKAKRDSVQSTDDSRFQNSSTIMVSENNDVQQNNVNGGNEGIVIALPNFNMASDNGNQLQQQQFGLSPITQQEHNEK